MAALTEQQKDLAALIFRLFQDGKVDQSERVELRALWSSHGLTVPEVRQVVGAFVSRVWGEVADDGVVTDDERSRLAAVVEGLNLPRELLPGVLLRALARRARDP